jgi:putative toxin-antitoxin system antitoxin component (TIGR02293 family)
MNTPAARARHVRVKTNGDGTTKAFWEFTSTLGKLSDGERIARINKGYSALLVKQFRGGLGISTATLGALLNLSASTIERRERQHQALDSVASERLDRIAEISALARDVFEDEEAAARWLRSPNAALGGQSPVMLCSTELGSKQVRRVLHALEWGGAA